MKLILLGPVGSGKGTQAGLISQKYGIPSISTGEIFRTNIKNETETNNINITNSNFVGMSHDVLYGGLFAQLNDNALIENISFTGSFDLSLSSDAYLGMLASVNAGKVSNVGIKVDGSIIDYAKDFAAQNERLYFGGLTGINVGEIVQNFDLYDASFDLESADMEGYEGYNFKID